MKNKSDSKNDQNSYQQDILSFLKKHVGKNYSAKEISHALQVKKSDYHHFSEALQTLARKRKIIRFKGRRFGLPAALQKKRGVLQVTRKGFGFVMDEQSAEEYFIPAQHLNTAFDGDTVEIQLFAHSRGRSKEGEVMEVLQRAHRNFVGTYHRSEYYGFVVPDNVRVYRDFYIPGAADSEAKDGQKVVVEFVRWEKASLNPEGKIIEILGFPDEPGVDVVSVVKGFELPLQFPAKVEKAARDIRFDLSPKVLEGRLDLREEITFTIDPADAKDFDDAVSLKKLQNGNFSLGVHIADVSHFVEADSLLDKEAFTRGTSIYLVDRVVPMLPEHLSNELCSLQPHVPRLTFSCIMEMTPAGKVVDYTISPSVINSKRRFAYEEVQEIIDNPQSREPFAGQLREMRDFSRILKKRRMEKGSIDFETPEVRFRLDERGKPVEIIPIKRLQSHELIEEFMLMANQTVASHIRKISTKGKNWPFIYRVHERPDPDKIENFQRFLNALDFKIKIPKNITPHQFQEILEQVMGTKD
ncbi:MAG: VacB/RNase II family 3'-5' exoribonuclease, partial [Calditrichia bacterium]